MEVRNSRFLFLSFCLDFSSGFSYALLLRCWVCRLRIAIPSMRSFLIGCVRRAREKSSESPIGQYDKWCVPFSSRFQEQGLEKAEFDSFSSSQIILHAILISTYRNGIHASSNKLPRACKYSFEKERSVILVWCDGVEWPTDDTVLFIRHQFIAYFVLLQIQYYFLFFHFIIIRK